MTGNFSEHKNKKGDRLRSPFSLGYQRLLSVNLIKDPTIIEVRLLHGAPVTEGLLYRQEIHFREAVGVLGQYRRITRTQVVCRSNFLAFRW